MLLPPLYRVIEAEGMQLTRGKGVTGYSGVYPSGAGFIAKVFLPGGSVRYSRLQFRTAVEAAVEVARRRAENGVQPRKRRNGVQPRKTRSDKGVSRGPMKRKKGVFNSDASDMTDEQAVEQAAKEGLVLVPSANNKTGYANVGRHGRNRNGFCATVGGTRRHLGFHRSCGGAALTLARLQAPCEGNDSETESPSDEDELHPDEDELHPVQFSQFCSEEELNFFL